MVAVEKGCRVSFNGDKESTVGLGMICGKGIGFNPGVKESWGVIDDERGDSTEGYK